MSLYALFPGSNDPLTTTSHHQPTTGGGGTTCSSRSLYRPASPISAVVLDFSTMKSLPSSPSKTSSSSKRRQISRSHSFSTTDTTEALSMSSTSFQSYGSSTSGSGPLHDTPIIKHDQYLKIQVREVKINFNKLCCTGGGSATSNSPTKGISGSSSRTSVCRSKRDGRLRRRSCTRKQDNSSLLQATGQQDNNDNNFSEYEKAIAFDLNIRYGGRNYVIRRNLNQIAQLRKDLLEELDFMDKFLSQQHHQQEDDEDSCSSSSSSSSIGGLNDSYSSISSDNSSSSTDSRIPPLPRMSEAGIFGGGFAQMNGMMQAYRPALESWFQNTISTTLISEDNPVLSNFLWEPLSSVSGEDQQQQQDALSLVHSNLQQLGSIQEC